MLADAPTIQATLQQVLILSVASHSAQAELMLIYNLEHAFLNVQTTHMEIIQHGDALKSVHNSH